MSSYPVTFTVDAHKKRSNWKWRDGTLSVSADGRSARLKAEEGDEVVARVPLAVAVAPGNELALTSTIVVCIDEPGPQTGAGAAAASASAAPAVKPTAQPAHRFGLARPGGKFRPPRPAQPSGVQPAAAVVEQVPAAPRPAARQQALQAQWQQQPAAQAHPLAAPDTAQPRAAEGKRSEDDVLRLLNGTSPPPPKKQRLLPQPARAPRPAGQPPEPPAQLPAPPPPARQPLVGTWAQPAHLAAGGRWSTAQQPPVEGPCMPPGQLPAQPGAQLPAASSGPPASSAAAAGSRWTAPWPVLRPPGAADPAAPGSAAAANDGGGSSRWSAPRPVLRPPAGAASAAAGNGGGGGSSPAQLLWPSPGDCAQPQRRVAVPDSFPSSQSYAQAWRSALGEELNLRIQEVAQRYYAAAARQGQAPGPAGPAGGGRGGPPAPAEAALRQAGVAYYANCELSLYRKKGEWGRSKREEDEPAAAAAAAAAKESHYLTLKSGRQRSSEYHRGDLWLISSNPEFRAAWGQLGDRSRMPWVAAARALWHGPNPEGKFEVEWLSAAPPGLGRAQAVWAIKGPDVSTELGILELLQGGGLATLPLLPVLLGRGGAAGAGAGAVADGSGDGAGDCCAPPDGQANPAGAGGSSDAVAQAEEVVQQFGLNEEQAEVVAAAAAWCQLDPGTPPTPILIHGPFGSGKSTLLVALLHFLLRQRACGGSPLAGCRMLVAASTNVAVDRVLLGLQESGCTTFLRVGPIRRIAPQLLPQSLHCSEGKAGVVAELKQMLAEAGGAGDGHEAAVIQQELALAERGTDRQRKKQLSTAPIVGVTCCSAMLPALDGQQFDVVILDECSQMVEPLSLVPLLRSQCRYLVAAGDPQQLPPVIASPTHVGNVSSGSGGGSAVQSVSAVAAGAGKGRPSGRQPKHGLLRPLFVRLAALGRAPHLLRRQYRCHPDISAVPNQHFYSGRLVDGCAAAARASLLPGLPSLVWLDVRGQEAYGGGPGGRSASNQQEAAAVVEVVRRLAQVGVSLRQVGVICLFRAQVALVQRLLDKALPQLVERQREERRRLRSSEEAGAGCSAEGQQGGGAQAGGGGCSGSGGGRSPGGGDATEEGAGARAGGCRVATVDSFQGAERDVIILTTAVTTARAFAADACRINVALTRARNNLVIVGCAEALQQAAPAFAAVVARCRATRGGFSPSGRLPC